MEQVHGYTHRKDDVLKALQGGRALRAASVVFRYAH